MTISFSGLASGLDTSSWVESLVALKQAKVETLEEEKETVLLSQETLNNIKSFFSSFRTLIEKVTDAKFGVPTMDLFAQNLANSSNLEVLTASATTEAEEATYNVLVDKLATETQVISNYSYLTTIVQTTTATHDSKLTSLGVKAGNIGVSVNGVERGLEITENDTIATFIEKLQNIGVEASYNEETGVFNMNVSDDAINDIDGTGIVDALHLEGVNEGYTSDHLQTSSTDTVYSAATEATLMSELGVNAGVITVHANDRDYNITISNSSTLGSFITDLENNDIDVELDATGVFTISDAEITNEGTTNILDALGFAVDIYGKTQVTGDLTHETIITQTTTATSATLLKDLGDGTAISDGQTVIVRDSNNEYTTINVGTTTTLGDLLQEMSNAGLYAALNSDGTVEIAGGTITGGTFDAVEALGLEREPYTAMVTGDPLTETVEVHKLVDLQTRLVDDLKVTEGYLEVTDADGNLYYEKIYSGQTIADFMTDMGNLGINTSLDEETGILTITGGAFKTLTDADVQDLVNKGTIREPDSRYIKGTNLLECLYGSGTISTDHITVASTYSKTMALSHQVTNTIQASLTTQLGNLHLTNGTAVFDVRGEARTINLTQNMTIEDLMNALENVGIESSWDDEHSKIMIENATLTGGTSNLSDVLNLTTTVSGKYVTSNELYSRETIGIDATRDTVLSDYGISNSMSTADRTVNLYNSDGSVVASMVLNENMTIGGLLDWINGRGAGISATLEDGYLTIHNGYIKNATLENTMGLENSNKSSYVLGSIMTITTTAGATGDTTLGAIISELGTQAEVAGGYNLNFKGIDLAVSANTTLNELIKLIQDNGGTAALDGTGRLTVNGGTLTGSVADALGIVSITTTSSVSASGDTLMTEKTAYADSDTKFSDLGINNSSYIIHDKLGNALATFNVTGTTTIGSFLDTLKANGINGVIADGVITLDSLEGKYITGALANSLGIAVETTTEIINTTQSSTLPVTHTGTITADVTTTLGDIGAVTAGGNENIYIFNADQVCIATISNLTTSSTIGDMFEEMKAYGIEGSIINGIISLYSEAGSYATGEIMDNLGIEVVSGIDKTFTIAQTTSSTIQVTHTTIADASLETKLSEFIPGLTSKDIVIYQNTTGAGGAIGTIRIDDTTTFQDFFDALKPYDIIGTIDRGVISLVSPSGSFLNDNDLKTYLGIDLITDTIYVTTGAVTSSSSQITHTVITDMTEDTLLSDLGITTSDSIVVRDTDGTPLSTITFSGTSTVKDLLDKLAGYDINGSVSGGIITLTSDDGKSVVGSIADKLGFDLVDHTYTATAGATTTSSGQIMHTVITDMTEDTLLTDIGVDVSGNLNVYQYPTTIVSGPTMGQLVGSINLNSSSTVGDLIDELNNYGIDAYVSNGILHLSSDNGRVISGSIADDLGITIIDASTPVTVGLTSTSTLQITQTVISDISESTQLSDMGVRTGYSYQIYVNDIDTNRIGTITFSATSTIGDMFSALQNYGIYGSINNNVISLSSTNGNYITGTVADDLGIGLNSYTRTVTTGATTTSNSPVTYTDIVDMTSSSTFYDIGADVYGKQAIVHALDGSVIGTVTVSSTSTVGEFINKLNSYGISGFVNNGVISLSSSGGIYITGSLADELGIGTTSSGVRTITTGTTTTSSSPLMYTYNVTATGDTQLGEAVDWSGSNNVICYDRFGDPTATFTVSKTMSINEFFNQLSSRGFNGSISSSGVISITSDDGGYVSGNVISALGISTIWHRGTDSTVGLSASSSSPITYDEQYATMNHVISDVVNISGSNQLVINNATVGAIATIAITNSMTFNDLASQLAIYNIDFNISSGRVSISQDSGYEGRYVTGSFLNAIGVYSSITTIYQTVTTGQTVTSSSPVTYDTKAVITKDTLMSDITSTSYIRIVNRNGSGGDATTIYTNSTVGEVLAELNAAGIDCSLTNGIIYFSNGYNDNKYIEEISDLGISYIHGYKGITATSSEIHYTTDTGLTHTLTSSDTDVTLGQIGVAGSGTFYIGSNGGTGYSIEEHFYEHTTLGELQTQLSYYGITLSISDAGILQFRSSVLDSGSYIYDGDNISAFQISVGRDYTYEEVIVGNTNSDQIQETVTRTMNINTTLGELGLSGNYYVTVCDGLGTYSTMTLSSTDDLEDLAYFINDNDMYLSINNGRVTIEPGSGIYKGYVAGMSYSLQSALNLGSFYTTDVIIDDVNASYSSTSTISGRTGLTATADTTIGDLGISSGSGVISFRVNNPPAIVSGSLTPGDYSFTFDVSDTLGNIAIALQEMFGIPTSFSNGKFTFNGTEDNYILSMSSALEQAFNISTGNGYTYETISGEYYTMTDSNALQDTAVSTVTMSNTLSDLGLTSDGTIRVQNGENTYTITVSSSDTLNDLSSALYNYGISTSLTNGNLSISGSGENYITYISSNLSSALKVSYGENVTYNISYGNRYSNTNSNYYQDTEIVTMQGSTTLGQLGMSGSANITIRSNGTENVVVATSDMSIDDLLDRLGDYGISGYVSGGSLTLSGTNDDYILSMSSTLSNLLHINTGNGYTYYAPTSTSYTNTDSNYFQTSEVTSVNSSSTMADAGLTSNGYITVRSGGTQYIVTVSSDMTFAELSSTLAGFGISTSLTNGRLSFTGTSNSYITAISSNLEDTFHLEAGEGYTYESKTNSKVSNSNSDYFQDTDIVTVTSSTTFGEAGMSGNAIITIRSGGTDYTLTIRPDMTFGDFNSQLAGFGISSSLSNGRLTITGTSNNYILSMTDNIKDTLKLEDGEGYTYVSTVIYDYSNTSSDYFQDTEIQTIKTSTTFGEIGLSGNTYITVNSNGTQYTITVTPDMTVNDLSTALAGYGITTSLSGGRLTFRGREDNYIFSMSDDLKNALHLQVGEGHTYISSIEYEYSNTDSDHLESVIVSTMRTSTTLDELGVTGNNYITVFSNDTECIVTITPDMTVGEMMSTLAGLGISSSIIDGRLTFSGNKGYYIKGMTDELKDALALEIGEGHSWVTAYGATWVNTDSDKQSYVDDGILISGDTILSSIQGFTGGELLVHKSDGTYATITVDASKTLDDFFKQIQDFGLVGTVDSQGKVTITGVGNVYLQAASGGSNILTSLKMSNVVHNVQTVTVNSTSDSLTHIVTVAASGTTTLENLQDINGNSINFTGSNVSLVLETTSGVGTQRFTLNFTKTQSLYDVIDELSKYGIQASIDASGRFSVTSSNLTDFDISGELGEFLMGNYTKEYGEGAASNISTNLIEQTVITMSDATPLSQFGINGGNILITQQGVNYTVNVDPTQIITIGDFRNLLSQYGFTTSIDDQGRLSVAGIGESYLTTIAGGSNILDVLGLTDWTLGEITQSSDYLGDTEVIVNRISMTDKISELTDAAGNNLGITNGQIYVYQDGTRSTVNIDTNDTLETLAAKLSQYGITVGISQEGRLYFDGNNDSYLTTNGLSSANASNILSKLNIEGNWSTRYDSESQRLQYTEEVINVVDRSTKLSDLKDSAGNDLNITEGTYYVYSNGVRNTETITADTTVNDFMATLAKYGLVADIAEDGSISVGAYNNSYLATSALAGQNSNVVSTLFAEWDFVNIYTSNGLDIPTDEIRAINRDTKLADINEGTYQEGFITVVKDGVQTNIELKADDTVGTLMDELALYGFESVINEDGQLIIKNSGDSLLQNYTGSGQASNALTLLGIGVNDWISTNTYKSDTLNVIQTSTLDANASRDTLLSELGVSTGEYYVYNNGVKYTALISSDETLGSFMDTLKSFGLETSLVEGPDGSVLSIVGKGNSYIAKSVSDTNASNVVDVLFTNGIEQTNEYSGLQQTSEIVTTFSDATLDTKLSYFDTPWGTGMLTAEGDLSVTVNGVESIIKITADETFGSLIEKFNALGVEATLANGELMIQSGYDTFTINTAGTTSSLLATIGLTYHDDLGGYVASQDTVKSTTTSIEERTLSVANYADMATELGTLNISGGTLTIYRNGERKTIDIQASDTFSSLQARISGAFNDNDMTVEFQDGYLTIYSKQGDNVQVGATTDTSNFAAITGIANDGSGTVKSARELYKVNGDSVITSTGLFRNGDVTEGTFVVGNATFNITDTTTLSNLISQINSSDEANATAFWDNIDGKLVIKSRTTGSAYVNIEAGTSNFTDVMGYTSSEWAADGSLDVTRMNIDTQEVGDNARVQINGTTYTSTSNTITSDVSRIKGLTINLKGLTEGTAVTLTVERDKETLANAVSDIVDSYNELMKNVDEAIASEGALHGETTLKLIRNQLRNMMTSSDAGTTIFRNLDSIGISVSSASASNISTTNEAIINLAFDKEQFLDAFEADQDAVKELLIGGVNNTGIFTKVETLLESALQSVSGYFSSADDAYQREINRLDDKIAKANEDVERYRARLEAKFSAMDMLIAQMQQQYSTFLTT